MPRRRPPLFFSSEKQEYRNHGLGAQGTPKGVALRCRIVLAAAAGLPDPKIVRDLQVSRPTVGLWRERFSKQGLESLWKIAPGRGRKPTYTAEQVKAVLDATLQSKPKGM